MQDPVHYPLNPHIKQGFHGLVQPRYSGVVGCAGVVVTARGGGVRMSPHFYNSEEEVEIFLKALP